MPRQSRSKIKVMLTVFFDYRGVVHYEFVPTVRRKRKPVLWANNSWIWHHDMGGCHYFELDDVDF